MVTQSYHLFVEPDIDREKYIIFPPKLIQFYISDATIHIQDERATLSCLQGRIFHGVILLSEYTDLLCKSFISYKRINLSSERKFWYKVYSTHEDAWTNLFDGGRLYLSLSFRFHNAEEFSSELRKILKQELLLNFPSLVGQKWNIVQEKDLDVISKSIKTNFLDTRPPLP